MPKAESLLAGFCWLMELIAFAAVEMTDKQEIVGQMSLNRV